jgi:hypothetical protein
VIIGGIVASIGPIATLVEGHLRRKRDSKLKYLKSERNRLEQLYTKTLDQLGDAMAENRYPSKMTSDITILMPKNVSDRFEAWMKKEDPTEKEGKHAFMDIALAMKTSLADIDEQIKNLVLK